MFNFSYPPFVPIHPFFSLRHLKLSRVCPKNPPGFLVIRPLHGAIPMTKITLLLGLLIPAAHATTAAHDGRALSATRTSCRLACSCYLNSNNFVESNYIEQRRFTPLEAMVSNGYVSAVGVVVSFKIPILETRVRFPDGASSFCML